MLRLLDMEKLTLYNTLSREKDEFIAIHAPEVKIYSCGPTVYHYAHLGNLRTYTTVDILNNTLLEFGFTPEHQINLTDVGHLVSDSDSGEDKMEKGAKREGKSIEEIANFYTEAFFSDLNALQIDRKKYIWTKASEYIAGDIKMIKTLEERGYTYETSDGVYFDTSKYKDYAKLARLDIKGLEKGHRVEDENNEKKNKTDFALWKFSPKGEARQMEWDSPWGIGFPGWHIECSVMSREVLGEHIDIHTGGIDLIPTHHTNEIAQSVCSMETGGQLANYWLHVNFLNTKDEKMSKSSGDFLRLETIIQKGYSPLTYKYLLLMTHYRKELNFSFEALTSAANALKKLQNKYENLKKENTENTATEKLSTNAKNYQNKFLSAMADDLNTPQALAQMQTVLSDKNLSVVEKYHLLKYFDKFFKILHV